MGCDRICDLPDSLLTQILLNLETKDSVKTSVLSTRWRNLWLSVPGLDLTPYDFPGEQVFVRFIERFMEINHGSRLQKFKIVVYFHFARVMEFINTVVDSGVQRLDVSMYLGFRYNMRQSIYTNKKMVSLKLLNVELKNHAGFVVSLPCLNIMHLIQVFYGKDGPLIVEKLISGAPLLEDLELIQPSDILNEKDVLLFLRVGSQTLKRCCLEFVSNSGNTDFTVEIDAPRLKYLRLVQSNCDSIVAKNLSSLFTIHFYFNYYAHVLRAEDLSKRDIFCDFLTRISSVKDMIICEMTLKVLYSYSKLGPLPKFNNLYHLEVKLSSSSLHLLLAFLESCPNLKKLILGYFYLEKPSQINFTNVPRSRCLISTLEYVEIKTRKIKDETEIQLVNYFLENSAVLKKLTLSFTDPCITDQEAESFQKLFTSTKLSPTCQLVIQ